MTLRALTLHRPWPWSILHGGKRIENRPWKPWKSIVGERIALHAGKTWDYDGAEYIRKICPAMPGSGDSHPHGVIVGLARVVGCVGDLAPGVDPLWFFGPFGWILEDVVALETPVLCRGAQGLWIPPADVTARVLEQAREAAR